MSRLFLAFALVSFFTACGGGKEKEKQESALIEKKPQVTIVRALTVADIQQDQAEKLLLDSFVGRFLDDMKLAPEQLGKDLHNRADVEAEYRKFLEYEMEKFEKNEVIWLNAFVDGKLAGFAVYEAEKADASYLSLLSVAPAFQKMGVGKKLIFSIREILPKTQTINLLVRKVNKPAYEYYKRLGFKESDYTHADPIDPNLLHGLTWHSGQH